MDTEAWVDMNEPTNTEGPVDDRDVSHQGGKYEVVHEYWHQIPARCVITITLDISLTPLHRGSKGCKCVDNRTWAEMIQRRDAAWEAQMPALVEAYLRWKHRTDPIPENEETFSINVVGLDSKKICPKDMLVVSWLF
jgi:hypothetical protein